MSDLIPITRYDLEGLSDASDPQVVTKKKGFTGKSIVAAPAKEEFFGPEAPKKTFSNPWTKKDTPAQQSGATPQQGYQQTYQESQPSPTYSQSDSFVPGVTNGGYSSGYKTPSTSGNSDGVMSFLQNNMLLVGGALSVLLVGYLLYKKSKSTASSQKPLATNTPVMSGYSPRRKKSRFS